MYSPPKLSIVAQYDDLVRYGESMISADQIEDKIKLLLENFNKQRLEWIRQNRELNESRNEIKKLKEENKRLETTLKHTRAVFSNEVNLKEKFRQERDTLLSKLTFIQNYLLEDVQTPPNDFKEKILSSLNISKFQPIAEHNTTSDNDSLSDIEFDKTGDDNLISNGDNFMNSTKNRLSSSFNNNKNSLAPSSTNDNNNKNETRKRKTSFDNLIKNITSPKKGYNRDDDLNSVAAQFDPIEEQEKADQFDEDQLYGLGKFNSGTDIAPEMDQLKEMLKQNRLSINNINTTSNGLNDLKLDKTLNRPHQFVTKKIIRPEKCGPCGQSIGFCTTGYRCRDCRAICHMSCKDQVPLPCIPYISRANIGKQGKLILISDYVPINVRPCVPALIIHCCTEIEKRGLNEIGLYRIAGSKKDVTELKERILDSKKGMPNLNTTDIYTLCSVVKEFLKDLDESLITRLAWRDFVTGASLTDLDQRNTYLKDLISNLHVANRDTLAYLILHLQRIAESPDCKMPISNLAKVFAPTIVGSSIKDLPLDQRKEETYKQIAVMESLLELETEFWENLISSKSNVPTVGRADSVRLLENLNRGSSFTSKTDGYSNYSNSRMSIGSRLCGGRIASGTLTPLKASNSRVNSNKISSFKPLF